MPASNKTTVGFIGLGNIGKPMAQHLINDAMQLVVHDVAASVVEELVAAGASAAATPAELASQCVHIGICVRDDNDVDNILYGDNGLLATAKPDTVIAIHSTVTQDALKKWYADATAKGVHLLDAPMTGGQAVAEEGKLCYMVGGDAAIVERCRPFLETSGIKIIHTGGLGTGMALKLCNNFLTWSEYALMSEAVRLAHACGLDPELLREVGKSNGVVNEGMWYMVWGRDMLLEKHSPEELDTMQNGIFGRLGRKDLQCALDSAATLDVYMPLAEIVRDKIEDVFTGRDGSPK